MKHIIHHWIDMQNQEITFVYWDDETDRVFEKIRKIEKEVER